MTSGTQQNIWTMSSRDKGLAFEEEMGFSNLPANHQAFDQFEPDTGNAISLKAMDTGLPSFQTKGQLFQRLKGAVDDAANYDGVGPYAFTDPGNIGSRSVYVIFRSGTLNEMLLEQMSRAVDYAQGRGVNLFFGQSSG